MDTPELIVMIIAYRRHGPMPRVIDARVRPSLAW